MQRFLFLFFCAHHLPKILFGKTVRFHSFPYNSSGRNPGGQLLFHFMHHTSIDVCLSHFVIFSCNQYVRINAIGVLWVAECNTFDGWDSPMRWVNNFLTCKRSAPPHRYVCINNKYRFGCVTCSTMALHVAHGMPYVYFCAVDRWSMCLSQHLLFLLATARKFICANCTREWLPCDRQPAGLVWSISIGRNLNVISHKSQRLIAVVVANLMVVCNQKYIITTIRGTSVGPVRLMKIGRAFTPPHTKCRTKWKGYERHGTEPISFSSSVKIKSAEFFCFCFHLLMGLCVIYVSGRLSRGYRQPSCIGTQRTFT